MSYRTTSLESQQGNAQQHFQGQGPHCPINSMLVMSAKPAEHACGLIVGVSRVDIEILWDYFKRVYTAVMSHYKVEVWYHDATWLGQPTFVQFASLQAFWPGPAPPRSPFHGHTCPLCLIATRRACAACNSIEPNICWREAGRGH